MRRGRLFPPLLCLLLPKHFTPSPRSTPPPLDVTGMTDKYLPPPTIIVQFGTEGYLANWPGPPPPSPSVTRVTQEVMEYFLIGAKETGNVGVNIFIVSHGTPLQRTIAPYVAIPTRHYYSTHFFEEFHLKLCRTSSIQWCSLAPTPVITHA